MEQIQTQEQENRIIEGEIKNFYAGIVSYGYLDIKRAIEVFNDVNLTGDDLAEEVLRFVEDTGTALENIDVVYIAYEYILQRARNKISEILEYDFLNDGEGDIYTYGNYLCSSYDSTETTKEELLKKFQDLTECSEEQKTEILEDKPTEWFLKEIEVI